MIAKRTGRLATFVLAASALLVGQAVAQPLVVCTEASPDYLNPQFSNQNTAYDVSTQIYERLVSVERGGSKIEPALAESWSVSDDGLAWTFRLRPNVAWQSNRLFKPTRALDADDVVYTFRRMMDPADPYAKVGGIGYQFFGNVIQPSLERVEKVDAMTVRLVLKRPMAPLLGALSVDPMSILSAEYAEAMLKAGTPETTVTMPIGTGPFSLVAYQKDAQVRFRAFPEHWAKKAGLADRAAQVNDLVFVITPDAAIRYAKVRSGECQIARYPAPGDLPALREDANLKLLSGTIADMSFLAFNTEKTPFQDKRVREALVYATDIPAIIDAVYLGTGKQTAAQVPPTLWSHDADLKPRPYDPAKAKQLLAEAGFPNGFKTTLWAIPVVRAYMPNGRRAAELIQADWAKVGVEAQIVTYEWGEYLKRAKAGEHDVAMLGYTWDYPDPSQILTSGWSCQAVKDGNNRARWCNTAYSDLLAKANEIADQDARAKLYVRAQEIFQEDVGGMLFANATAYTPVRKNVEGYKIHFFGGQPFVGVSLR
jgi:dipeptide transport system substrate-binding protein